MTTEAPDEGPADEAVTDAVVGAGIGPDSGGGGASAVPQFGTPGPPLNRNGPYYWGFVGAAGALIAYFLLGLLSHLSQIFTLIAIAAFIAIGLDPLVRALQKRGMRRGWAVAIVFIGVLLVVVGFLAAVLPGLVSQSSQLASNLPDQVNSLTRSEWLKKLDDDYGVLTNASEQLRKKLSDGATLVSLFGGLLGAGKAVISGFFSVITVLVLTLYFLASLRGITESCYRLVPSTRRERVRLLGDEILKRIGGFVAGQVAVASINGFLTFILASILGLPYSVILAVAVAILGLIPLIGATLGAIIVVIVGLFQSVQIAAIIAVYYVVYQQIENYLISPRVMSRTVAVPGAVAVIAALAGAALLGIVGAMLAIPVAAAILLIVQEVVIPRQDRN